MVEYSVICVLSASYILFCTLTAASWPSPSISRLNATDGPFNGTLTIDQASWLGSLPGIGCILGPLIGSFLSDLVGRKMSLLLYAVPVIASYFTMAFANNIIGLYYFARFIVGISLGSLFALTPVYVGEMSLNEHRGILSSIIGIFSSAGNLFALSTGPYMSVKAFNIMLGVLPLGFLLEFFVLGLESPHYFVSKGKDDKAKAVLRKMRNCSDEKVKEELDSLKNLIQNQERGTLYDIFRSKGMIRAFVIILTLFTFSQLSGIMVIQTYAQQVFEQAGSTIPSEICAIVLCVVALVTSTFIPVLIAFVGRKPMLICSGLATSAGQILLGIYFYLDNNGTDLSSYRFLPLIFLILIIVASSCGFLLIPMLLLSEIFPNATKGIASNISTSYSFVVGFFVSKYFLIFSNLYGPGPSFIGFSIFPILSSIFTYFFVIETKGKSLKDILDELNS